MSWFGALHAGPMAWALIGFGESQLFRDSSSLGLALAGKVSPGRV